MLLSLLAAATLLLSAVSTPAFTYLGDFGKPGSEQNGAFSGITHLAVDSIGDVWIANPTAFSRLQEFTASGSHLHTWWSRGDIKTQLDTPGPLAFTPDGSALYVITHSNIIWKGTRAGSPLLTFGGGGNADDQFHNAAGIAVDSLGNVYVSDKERSTISKFTASGKFLTSWRIASVLDPEFLASVRSLTDITVTNPNLTKTDFLYVIDGRDSCVLKLDTTGKILQRFGTRGSGNAQLNDPQSVVVDKNGLVYVADTGNQRIEVFEPNGAFAFSFKGNNYSGYNSYEVTGLAFSPNGNVLYVLLSNVSKVQRFQIY